MRLSEVADHQLPIAFTMLRRLLDADKPIYLVLAKSDGRTYMGQIVEAEAMDDGLFRVDYYTNMTIAVRFTRRQMEHATIKSLTDLPRKNGDSIPSFIVPVAKYLDALDAGHQP